MEEQNKVVQFPTNDNGDVDMDALNKYINTVEIEKRKADLYEAINNAKTREKQLLDKLTGDVAEDIISAKLAKYNTVEELTKQLKDKESVEWFFKNDETGEVLSIINDKDLSPEEKFEFKKGLLIFMKQTEIYEREIDEEIEKFNKTSNELNVELSTALSELSNNLLDYTAAMKEKVQNAKNDVSGKSLKEIEYIESGYNLKVLNDVLDEYPSVIKNTLKDIQNPTMVSSIGKRYASKLKSNKSRVSLYPFVNDDLDKSFEATFLPPDKYRQGYENLFIFSLIRYFGMENWGTDNNVKKFHASINLMLRKLQTNELSDELKETVLDAVVNYLNRFYAYIDSTKTL